MFGKIRPDNEGVLASIAGCVSGPEESPSRAGANTAGAVGNQRDLCSEGLAEEVFRIVVLEAIQQNCPQATLGLCLPQFGFGQRLEILHIGSNRPRQYGR